MASLLALIAFGMVGASHHHYASADFVGPPSATTELSPFSSMEIEPRKPHWWQSLPPVSEPWRHSVEHLGLRGFRGTIDSELGWRSTMGVPLLTITFDLDG